MCTDMYICIYIHVYVCMYTYASILQTKNPAHAPNFLLFGPELKPCVSL